MVAGEAGVIGVALLGVWIRDILIYLPPPMSWIHLAPAVQAAVSYPSAKSACDRHEPCPPTRSKSWSRTCQSHQALTQKGRRMVGWWESISNEPSGQRHDWTSTGRSLNVCGDAKFHFSTNWASTAGRFFYLIMPMTHLCKSISGKLGILKIV
jgi:hypothetical protein